MFSGLNKLIKIILPKRLFYRALIIVAAPTIILQLIVTIVFFDSIWIKANKGRRLDHIWSTTDLAKSNINNFILRDARGWERPSDHAPIFSVFDRI